MPFAAAALNDSQFCPGHSELAVQSAVLMHVRMKDAACQVQITITSLAPLHVCAWLPQLRIEGNSRTQPPSKPARACAGVSKSTSALPAAEAPTLRKSTVQRVQDDERKRQAQVPRKSAPKKDFAATPMLTMVRPVSLYFFHLHSRRCMSLKGSLAAAHFFLHSTDPSTVHLEPTHDEHP